MSVWFSIRRVSYGSLNVFMKGAFVPRTCLLFLFQLQINMILLTQLNHIKLCISVSDHSCVWWLFLSKPRECRNQSLQPFCVHTACDWPRTANHTWAFFLNIICISVPEAALLEELLWQPNAKKGCWNNQSACRIARFRRCPSELLLGHTYMISFQRYSCVSELRPLSNTRMWLISAKVQQWRSMLQEEQPQRANNKQTRRLWSMLCGSSAPPNCPAA